MTWYRPPSRTTVAQRTLLSIVLLGMTGQTWCAPPGRLFFTPDERNHLNEARNAGALTRAHAVVPGPQPEAPAATHVTINGIVRRSDGSATIWMNQHPYPTSERANTASSVVQGSTAMLRLPSGKTVRAKPGQDVDLSNGTLHDLSLDKPTAPPLSP